MVNRRILGLGLAVCMVASLLSSRRLRAEVPSTEPTAMACGARGFVGASARTRLAHARPPLLLSYPGSGNTWTRLLVEYASGCEPSARARARRAAAFARSEA